MARLEIRLLGPFQASLDGTPVTGFESGKVRALLAILAAEPGRPHPREALRNPVLALLDAANQGRPHLAAGEVPAGAFQVDASSPRVVVRIPALRIASYDRLSLVIVRLDPFEQADPVGEYGIVVRG